MAMTRAEAKELKEARRASLIEKWASGKRLTPDEDHEIRDVTQKKESKKKPGTDMIAAHLGVKKSQVPAYRKMGMPDDTLESCTTWHRANINSHKLSGIDIDNTAGVAGDFDWVARLQRARNNELTISRLCEGAIREKRVAAIDKLLSAQAHAIEVVAQAEKISAQVRMETGEILSKDEVEEAIREIAKKLIETLELMPVTERQRCNPDRPEVAQAALAEWRDRFLQQFFDMAKEYCAKP